MKHLLLFILLFPIHVWAGPLSDIKKDHKDDVVTLDNGDRITGEIKKMEHGILYLKSDRALDTLQLDWGRVQRIQSKARYEFETSGGDRFIGTLSGDSVDEVAIVLEDASVVRKPIIEILTMREMRKNVLGRINLSLDGGITFTQGNRQTQTTVQQSLQYTKPRYSFSQTVSSLFNHQSGSENTSRHEFQLLARRYFARRWEYLGLGALLSDNQQNLDLRVTAGGGFQRTFLKSNRALFAGIAGFVYTNEKYTAELESNRSNAEILTGLAFTRYRFRSSELQTYLLVFPSVTDFGRVRADLSGYWKWEIVSDLYWKFSVFDNFDSRPPAESPKNNFGVTSSVGWSF
jgi:hypothetical protein